MRPDRALLAASLTLAAVAAFVLVQLRRPTSWLSRQLDGATTLPAVAA